MEKRIDVFLDGSVDTGDISDELSDESIRTKIRDEYLRDTTVTILLVGLETMYRKHVDWEIYSSMYDGKINKKSGIVVVNLPEIGNFNQCYAPHGTSEKQLVYPDYEWAPIEDWREFRKTYPYVPDRIVDSLANGALISVSPWHRAAQPDNLRTLVELAYRK